MSKRTVAVVSLAVVIFAVPALSFAQSNPIVRIVTPLGEFSIELFEQTTPVTVANFLNYVNDGDYNDSFIHRSMPGFVIQGGGFWLNADNQILGVPADAAIVNEFGISNTRGTVAMAKLGGDPNSATSEWFVNLADNNDPNNPNSLDNQNGGFTVFGRVIGDGMDVVDSIAALQVWAFASPFDNLPLIDYPGSGDVLRNHFVVLETVERVVTALSVSGLEQGSVAAGASTLLTVTVTPGAEPASTGVGVSADLSSLGGSSSQTFFDDGTNGDVTPDDNTFSFLATIPRSAAEGATTIPITATDAESRTAGASLTLTITRPPGTDAFTLTNLGGSSRTSQGDAAGLVTAGYGQVQPDEGVTTPAGLAIFGLRQDGVLVTEAGVPAAAAVLGGRLFAEVNGPVNTGLAIANPNDVEATITFFFTGSDGLDSVRKSFTLGANQQTAQFLNQTPYNGGDSILGTFTFASSVPVSVVALRGFTNLRSEFLITTLPVVPLTAPSGDTIYFPHFADGDGWTTQVILVNPTDQTISGTIEFLGPGEGTTAALPKTIQLDSGSEGSSFPYSIPGRSSRRFTTSNPAGAVSVGSVRATADAGHALPAGLGIFSLESNGIRVSGAGVPALPEGTAFRVYVEGSGTVGEVGSIQSGVAITNASDMPNFVQLELTDLSGTPIAAAQSLTLPPSGQVARFVDQFFTLPGDFAGVLRITSTFDVAVVGLRARTNERSDFLITTTPPSNEAVSPPSVDSFFAHLVNSGGWSTQFVVYSGSSGQTSSGALNFFDQSGQALDLSLD